MVCYQAYLGKVTLSTCQVLFLATSSLVIYCTVLIYCEFHIQIHRTPGDPSDSLVQISHRRLHGNGYE